MNNYYYLDDQRYVSNQLNLDRCKSMIFKLERVDEDGVGLGIFDIVKGWKLVEENKLFSASDCSGCPKPVPTPPPTPVPSTDALNIATYWGSSGNANDYIPIISDIDPRYNILVLSFINFDQHNSNELVYCSNCNVGSNPCANPPQPTIKCSKHYNFQGKSFTNSGDIVVNTVFKNDIAEFKKTPDPYKRRRMVMVSFGGANGTTFLDNADAAHTAILAFLNAYDLDGIDIDLESGALSSSSIPEVLRRLKADGYKISAVPEPTSSTLDPIVTADKKSGRSILSYLDWIWPQFYNNQVNSTTPNYFPECYNDNNAPSSFQSYYNPIPKSKYKCTGCWPTGGTGYGCKAAANNICSPDVNGKCSSGATLCPKDPDWKQCASVLSNNGKWPWWAGVVDNLISRANLQGNTNIERGVCTPASYEAEANHEGSEWDPSLLKTQLAETNTKYVANWAVAYDIKNNKFWLDHITNGMKKVN